MPFPHPRGISNFGFRISDLPATHPKNHRGTERTQRKTQRVSQLGLNATVLCPSILGRIMSFEFCVTDTGLHHSTGALSRRGAVAEDLVARAARRGQLVRFSVPDGPVSRAAAEARSDSAMGGGAAAPTSGAEGLNQAPRNRSEAEIPRSRRDWASGCVSPTGAREG